MKGTEKIIAHIQADAAAQANAILAQAEEQCNAVKADFEAKAQALYAEKIRLGVKDCEARVESMERIAEMEAKKSILGVKQEMVGKSFEKAVEMIAALPQDEYVDFMAKLAANAATVGDEEIILNARDKEAIGEAVIAAADKKLCDKGVDGKLVLSDKTGSFAGGLIMQRGNIEVNCTVELLVELCRGDMSAELANMLFA